MPFCGECGNKLNENARFCGECGTSLGTPAPAAAAPAPVVVEVKTVAAPAAASPAPLTPGEELSLDFGKKGGEFDSPAMNRLLGNLPEPKQVVPDFGGYLADSAYSIKAANNGITKHVTNKLWTAHITGDAKTFSISKVYQYMAPVMQQEAYHAYFTDCEKNGYGLLNASKRLETMQAWYAPNSKEALEDILKNGFKNVNTLAFTKCPIQCCKESVGGTNTLVQCRVLLANHEDKFGKIFVKNAKGILIGFIVEYQKN